VIVGLDTATAATAAAAWAPDGPAVERRDDPPPGERPGHSARLLVLVEEALAAAGADWDAVERIAVGVGPGGFTGLRLGIATARALAQARGLPLAGVSSLEALAVAARDGGADSGHPVLALIDARRGEVFAAAWHGGERVMDPLAIAPADLATGVVPGTLAVGDGAVRFREELERAGAAVPPDGSPAHRVSALAICRLGARGAPTERDALLPDYRREPDAKPPRPS
jgi:tRNA threonylcarbamoyladenosine biosynthesis protein TsaB